MQPALRRNTRVIQEARHLLTTTATNQPQAQPQTQPQQTFGQQAQQLGASFTQGVNNFAQNIDTIFPIEKVLKIAQYAVLGYSAFMFLWYFIVFIIQIADHYPGYMAVDTLFGAFGHIINGLVMWVLLRCGEKLLQKK